MAGQKLVADDLNPTVTPMSRLCFFQTPLPLWRAHQAADDAQKMTPEDYEELNSDIKSVNQVADTLQRISAAVYNKPVPPSEEEAVFQPSEGPGQSKKGYQPL